MRDSFQPNGYSTVSPYLIVSGADATIDLLTRVFGATELRRFQGTDGRVMHAEVKLGDSVLMLADASEHWPAALAHVHVYVPDVDATFQRALDAGAAPVREPVREGDPDRRGAVKDAGGTTWWIATRQE